MVEGEAEPEVQSLQKTVFEVSLVEAVEDQSLSGEVEGAPHSLSAEAAGQDVR